MPQRITLQLNQEKHPGVVVEVEDRDGRLTIVGVQVRRPDGVTLEELRAVPIPRLEAAWNDPQSRDGKMIRSKLRRAGELASMGTAPEPPKPPTRRQLALTIPRSGRYPDAFYVTVAAVYHQLVANGIRPAPAIAEANGVPVRTVHGWVNEARRRGFMARGRRGRAG